MIIDRLTGNRISVYKENILLDTNALKELITRDRERIKEGSADGWYYYTVRRKSDEYYDDEITFYYKAFTSSYYQVVCYKRDKYAKDFDKLMQRVLKSITNHLKL